MVEGDTFQKFMLDALEIRGEWVRLDDSFAELCQNKNYPESLRKLLAETTAASLLLTGTLKFEGRLSIHARGSGPVSLLMAEATHERAYRSIVNHKAEPFESDDLNHLLGKAQLAITIEPDKGQRYQGIVPLEASNMGDCLVQYFDMSEQLDTFFMFDSDANGCFGLMLQKLPEYRSIQDQDAWDRVTQLANTLSFEEVSGHDNETLTHRLYHEEQVSLFAQEPVRFQCTCSPERSLASLNALGHDEVLDILEHEAKVAIDCQFCGAHYEFDRADVNALFGLGKMH
jgi:molecular chaperone Hsp33